MNKKGQALIEFIIILPIFIMLMLAVFDYVRIYSEKSNLESVIEDVILSNELNDDNITATIGKLKLSMFSPTIFINYIIL